MTQISKQLEQICKHQKEKARPSLSLYMHVLGRAYDACGGYQMFRQYKRDYVIEHLRLLKPTDYGM